MLVTTLATHPVAMFASCVVLLPLCSIVGCCGPTVLASHGNAM
jgi:hypothetical protein